MEWPNLTDLEIMLVIIRKRYMDLFGSFASNLAGTCMFVLEKTL